MHSTQHGSTVQPGLPLPRLETQPAPSEGGQTSSDMQQALLPKTASSYEHPISPWRRRYTVLLVAVIAALLSADQNLLAPNLSAAAAYFGLDDSQKDTILGGYIMAAFFAVGAPAALLCGYFADKLNRVYMLAFIVIVGEAPCLCTFWVTELWQFFLVRMLTGVSVGGCFPLVFSLLGDLFPVTQRAAMSSIIQIAIGGGIGGGQMVAGLLGPATNWRLPFLVMAAPTLLLVMLLLLTVKEPPRGGFEKALEGQFAAGEAYSEAITWKKMWSTLRVPSNWLIIMQGLFGCLPWGVVQTYINDYLHQQKGLSVELATTVLTVFGVGCAFGVIVGGTAGQALYNWRRPTMAVLTGLAVLAGVGPVMFLINADIKARGLGTALVMAALAGFLASIAGPNLRAIMLNVNPPETRGVALALQSVTDDLGKGLGPVVVAGFISQLGRTGAFNVSVSAWVPCGIMLTCLACTMGKDEDAMQARLAERSAQVLQQVQVDASTDSSGSRPDDPGFPGSSAPTPGPEPGPGNSTRISGLGDRVPLPPVLRRVFGRGPSVKVAPDSGEAGGDGLKSRAAAAVTATLAAVSATGSSRAAVPVLAGVASGSVEMQQLLGDAECDTSSRHCPEPHHRQQQQQGAEWHAGMGAQPVLHCRAPAGLEQQQQHKQQQQQQHEQQQQQHEQQQQEQLPELQVQVNRARSYSSGSEGQSSGIAVARLQHSCSQGAGAPASAAISAAGARHRTKQRESGWGSGGSGSGGACSLALGEGAEERVVTPGWQSLGVVAGRPGVVN